MTIPGWAIRWSQVEVGGLVYRADVPNGILLLLSRQGYVEAWLDAVSGKLFVCATCHDRVDEGWEVIQR